MNDEDLFWLIIFAMIFGTFNFIIFTGAKAHGVF